VKEVRRQFDEDEGILLGTSEPDYAACVAISTDASLREMMYPGALTMFTPLIVGFLFGPKCLAGVLAGALVSGVQMAISASNTGGAWDNAKKYIEVGSMCFCFVLLFFFECSCDVLSLSLSCLLLLCARAQNSRNHCATPCLLQSGMLGEGKGKGSDEHHAAVIGDTVGDPLKDTSGPSLNILIKLMAIISLVFASSFPTTGYIEQLFNK
jgi:inorganic pyrophosphatase